MFIAAVFCVNVFFARNKAYSLGKSCPIQLHHPSIPSLQYILKEKEKRKRKWEKTT